MIPIQVRTMQPEDAVAVNRLSAQLGYSHPVAETETRMAQMLLQEKDHLLVAVAGTAVVGWLHVYKTLLLESGVFAEIAALVVDENHRGQKVGEQLVAAAKAWCRMQHIARLRVRSNVVRTRAHSFYLRAGFKELKESKVFEYDL